MSRPRLLDLFCGAGGAAMGYHRAGFDVFGVDVKDGLHYPFEYARMDALSFPHLDGYDAIHASPPCQRYSTMTKKWGREDEHPDLILAVQELLYDWADRTGKPYVIENVPGAPLYQAVTLCGSMFGLQDTEGTHLQRHRIFESNVWFFPPAPCAHVGRAVPVYGNAGGSSKRDGIQFADTAARKRAMGIDWMTGKELAESIPPAYTEYIGKQLMAVLA